MPAYLPTRAGEQRSGAACKPGRSAARPSQMPPRIREEAELLGAPAAPHNAAVLLHC